jgi:membrane-bound lytic murein transglycosylase MltF
MAGLYTYIYVQTKQNRDLPEIKKHNVLNVVMEYNSVDFHVAGDSINGLQYELCRFIAHRSGLYVRLFLENDLEVSIKKLENKTYDIIARNIPITNENKQFLAFTVPVTQNKQVLVQRKAAKVDSSLFIANQIHLAGKTIHVTKNSPTILRLTNLADEIAEPVYVREIADYSSEQLIYMVAKNEINYTVVDKEIALKNADLFPELDFSTNISFTQLQAWALRKTSPVLRDSLNVWITEFKKDKLFL